MRILGRLCLHIRGTTKWKWLEFQLAARNGLKLLSGTMKPHISSPAGDDNFLRMYRRQLNDRDYEVRLLELCEPSNPGSRHMFECRLRHNSLKEALPYVALSYHWGDLQNKRDLVVEDTTIQVSDNLLAALQQLWHMNQRLIWVDFLCINQGDNDEKSGQVRMMDTIFAKAQTVFAWLGPESHDSELAMAILGASKLSEQVELPEEVEVACDAIIRLFSRPYWTRCWVIQEICRARAPVIVCGRRYVPWGTMLKRLDRLGTSIPAQYARHLVAPLRHMRYRDQNRFRADTETGLIPLIISSRRSLASDPRDKLYALLSMAKDGRVLIPTPNYSQTAEQIFLDTAKCMIEDHDRTDVILLAHRTRSARHLPTWVPDWANVQCRPPPWILDCLTQSRPRLSIQNKISRDILAVQGYHFDTVMCFLDMVEFKEGLECGTEYRSDPGRSQSVVVNLCMGMSIGDHANHEQLTIAQILRKMCDPNGSQASQPSRLVSWVAHNANRKIGGATLRQHLDIYLQAYHQSFLPVAADGDRGDDSGNNSLEQAAIEECFDRLERLRMTFAVTKDGSLRIVYRDAEPGDYLYFLQNCPLPVILRPTDSPGRFKFVGEVFASKHFQGRASDASGDTTTVLIE
ncbi:HET-domain-containing protein [Xylariaceae sp. FL1651]|nr:HET-domain-containing protein [Xylariaceae sp. FL1651]